MSDGPTRFRSPPYPYIGLQKAVERASQLYDKARNFAVPLTTAADAWGMKLTSSATLQTIAALLQYGLIDDHGARDARRVKLTELGEHIVMDRRPNSIERMGALQAAFLGPVPFRELWEKYGPVEVDDSVIIHDLTFTRKQEKKTPFSLDSAKEVIRLYRQSRAYAGLVDRQEPVASGANDKATPPNVGDQVQWAPGGNYALPEPARVRFVSPDGEWVFVEGSETGLPVREIEVVSPASEFSSSSNVKSAEVSVRPVRTAAPPTLPIEAPSVSNVGGASGIADNIKLTIDGDRVLITASVDLAGLRRLQRKLATVEALLTDDDGL